MSTIGLHTLFESTYKQTFLDLAQDAITLLTRCYTRKILPIGHMDDWLEVVVLYVRINLGSR